MTGRPTVVDLTYVAARLGAATPTGIERVDAAFARHFTAGVGEAPGEACAIHYGLLAPHALLPRTARRLVDEAAAVWRPATGSADDPVYAAVARWLEGPPRPLRAGPERSGLAVADRLRRWRWRLAADRAAVPRNAVYLNLAQYAFEFPAFLRWLERRPDVMPVFFIHDLLPLDHPEFFRAGYRDLFERRVATMARFARAAVVSSATVRERVVAEIARRGRRDMPIHAAPLPPPAVGDAEAPPAGRTAPYFLMTGTIEARKNHLLVLHAWRALAEAGGPVPRLVLVGPRGWENEQVVDLLERCTALAPHVAEVSGLSTPGLARLIRGARVALVPSFAEGYGLPLAEALAAGTPVVASDIPVFREVSQGCATLLDPTDGPGWRQAIADLAADPSPRRAAAVTAAQRYKAPDWPGYFAGLDAFLAML